MANAWCYRIIGGDPFKVIIRPLNFNITEHKMCIDFKFYILTEL